jgi:hypothetical protein
VSVEFEYEIDADDYASGITLYQKQLGALRYRFVYILLGTALVSLPIVIRHNNPLPIDAPWFTIPFGVFFLYCGIAVLFYPLRVRWTYRKSEVASARGATDRERLGRLRSKPALAVQMASSEDQGGKRPPLYLFR